MISIHGGGHVSAGMPRAGGAQIVAGMPFGGGCHELGCSLFYLLDFGLLPIRVNWTDIQLGFDCSQMGFPFGYLRHPLWAGLFRVCNVTHATVVSLRGSVGILDSTCSAMSYVAGFTICVST